MKVEDAKLLDANTKAELLSIKTDLHTTLIETISKEFRTLKEDITQLLNKDIKYHDDKLKEHDIKHKEHYDDHEKVRDKVDDVKDYFLKEISTINNKIDNIIAMQSARDQADETADRKKGLSNEIIFGIIMALISAGSIVFAFLK